ncbi:EF-hand domain-containing protein [Sphingomicrobium sp. XHP0235]|uniref:EF-hand domain-containing protein n=1 Tax=Sphingomicrobium aquimarinum TaxID=3133971 RepID=UPI0031FEDC27
MPEREIPDLTDAERETLEGILSHKTAKEIARDLDISHHAVEKRLKRAREKLGVTTSLKAARLYASRYGTTVSKDSDLAAPAFSPQVSSHATPGGDRLFTIGGTSLMFTSILLFAAVSGAGGAPIQNDGFDTLDKDRSGYIEIDEFSATVFAAPQITRVKVVKGESATANTIEPEEAVAMIQSLYERLDKDDDNRLSRAEYGAKGDTGNIRVIAVERD